MLRIRVQAWRWLTHELPWLVAALAILGLWSVLAGRETLPAPSVVARAFWSGWAGGATLYDTGSTLFSYLFGFFLGSVLGILLAILMFKVDELHRMLSPFCDLGRTISPLSLTPLAILWFGRNSSVALVAVTVLFPTALGWYAALTQVPKVYLRIARELELTSAQTWRRILLPAVAPKALRLARIQLGVCWIVVIAAEIIQRDEGLGAAIVSAENQSAFAEMTATIFTIGILGFLVDRMLLKWQERPRLQWGRYD